MTVFGITMMKDSGDVVRGVIEHMAQEVDHIIVADNMSTDGTRPILNELATRLPLTIIDDSVEAYYQSSKMTALAKIAADMGAHAIVPFDDDEIHFSHLGRIRDALADMPRGSAVSIPLYNHLVTLVDDPEESDPFLRIQWRQRHAGALFKVAYAWSPEIIIDMGNHGLSRRNDDGEIVPHDGLNYIDAGMEIRHFPVRSKEQFVRKALNGGRALEATNLSQDTGAHWRGYKTIHDTHGIQALHDVFDEHWRYTAPWESGLVLDSAPYRRWES